MKTVIRSRVLTFSQAFPIKVGCIAILLLSGFSVLVKIIENIHKLREPIMAEWTVLHQRLRGPLGQFNPNVIKFIREQKVIRAPMDSAVPYNLIDPNNDPSLGQSLIVKRIFKNKRNGFFVECGAFDGEGRSNTLALEKELGWTGLLIEADGENYEELVKKNRKAWTTNCCLSIHGFPHEATFVLNGSMSRMVQESLTVHWNTSHLGTQKLSTVQCYPLNSLLMALDVTTVDYLSLDVEGNEMDILATIPFNKLRIQVLSVEITHGLWRKNTSYIIRSFMKKRGYRFVTRLIANNSFANDLIFAHEGLKSWAQFPEEIYFYRNNIVDEYARPV